MMQTRINSLKASVERYLSLLVTFGSFFVIYMYVQDVFISSYLFE